MKSFSRVRLFMTPWSAAHQAPPSMRFSRQEYWSGVPLPSPLFLLGYLICGHVIVHSSSYDSQCFFFPLRFKISFFKKEISCYYLFIFGCIGYGLHCCVWAFSSCGKQGATLSCGVEKAMAPHYSTLAWKIPWTEEPGGLQTMGSRSVGHN